MADTLATRPRTEADVMARIKAHPVAGSPEEMRAAFEALVGPQPSLSPATTLDGLAVGSGPPLLFFHGGGYVFGSPESHAAMAERLASHGIAVVLPRYPLAPEKPWPAMLRTAQSALAALGGRPVVGGASAGGHLALSLALHSPEAVAGVALLSPNTDRSGQSETRELLPERDAMNDDASDAALAAMAFGDAAPNHTDVSPLCADLSALPPLHVEVGSEEVLLDDSVQLARRAVLCGRATALHVTPGLFHLAALWPDAIPEAATQLGRIAAFVRSVSA